MSKYLSNLVKEIEPYVPGEQPKDKKYIKLNTNENPYPPSKNVLSAISNSLNHLNLYPEPTTEDLRVELGNYYSLKKEQIFVGNGSDEVLAFAFMAFFNPGDTLLYPDITYSFYPVYAGLFKLKSELVKKCYVVKGPDPKLKLAAYAFVVTNEGIGHNNDIRQQIINKATEPFNLGRRRITLKDYELPHKVIFLDDLPLTKASKTDFRKLERMAKELGETNQKA